MEFSLKSFLLKVSMSKGLPLGAANDKSKFIPFITIVLLVTLTD